MKMCDQKIRYAELTKNSSENSVGSACLLNIDDTIARLVYLKAFPDGGNNILRLLESDSIWTRSFQVLFPFKKLACFMHAGTLEHNNGSAL